MAGSIICGVDDSESAKGAARVARALASELGLGLVFVRVVERNAPEAEISAVAKRLERLSAGAEELDCGAAWVVDAGHPADQLVAVAAKAGAALMWWARADHALPGSAASPPRFRGGLRAPCSSFRRAQRGAVRR